MWQAAEYDLFWTLNIVARQSIMLPLQHSIWRGPTQRQPDVRWCHQQWQILGAEAKTEKQLGAYLRAVCVAFAPRNVVHVRRKP